MPDFYDRARYDSELRNSIESIFSGITITDAADDDMCLVFACPDWQVVGLPADFRNARVERSAKPEDLEVAEVTTAWVSLFDVLRRIGERELVIAARPRDIDRPAEPILAAACKFDRRELGESGDAGGFLAYWEYLVFGRESRWGLTSHWQNFSILGADADFMHRYLALAGGVAAVRRRFEDFVEHQLGTRQGDGVEDRFARRVIRSIRWPT